MIEGLRRFGRGLVGLALTAALLAALVPLVAGCVRRLRPELDLFAEFASPALSLTVVALAIALVARRPRLSIAFALVASVLAWRVWPQWFPPAPPPAAEAQPVRLYFANLWAYNQRIADAARSVVASDADVAAMVEFTDTQDDGSSLLFDRYAYRWDGRKAKRGFLGTVIVSRYPIEPYEGRFEGQYSVLAARVKHPTTPFRLIVVHMTRPWPFETTRYQQRQVAGLIETLQRLSKEPTIVVGDFNATSINASLSDLKAQTGYRPAPAIYGDWPSKLPDPFRLAIENAFASPDLTILDRRLGLENGSDHRPIIVDFTRAKAAS